VRVDFLRNPRRAVDGRTRGLYGRQVRKMVSRRGASPPAKEEVS